MMGINNSAKSNKSMSNLYGSPKSSTFKSQNHSTIIGASGRESIASQKKRAGTIAYSSDEDNQHFENANDVEHD